MTMSNYSSDSYAWLMYFVMNLAILEKIIYLLICFFF